MAAFREHEPDALILLTPVPDPENYGVAELDDAAAGKTGRVVRLVEKPAHPASDLALVGVYMFTAEVHAAARAISPSQRGELEIAAPKPAVRKILQVTGLDSVFTLVENADSRGVPQ